MAILKLLLFLLFLLCRKNTR